MFELLCVEAHYMFFYMYHMFIVIYGLNVRNILAGIIYIGSELITARVCHVRGSHPATMVKSG